MRTLLLAGGWLYAAAIMFLSLTPKPLDPGFAYGDKLGHFAAYSLLMFWFCWLYRRRATQLAYGAGWIGLGVALEFAQASTGYRSFEFADMAANSLGVLLGWGISATLRR
jgi:VanZ family protein